MLDNPKDQELILNTLGIQVLYRRLIVAGHSKEDAGNTIARLIGLGESEKGWTVRELQYLNFFKCLNSSKSLEGT